jgi:hexosaminidase
VKRLMLLIAVLAMAFAAHVSAAGVVQDNRPCLVPWPQKIAIEAGSFTPAKSILIKTAGKSRAAQKVAETLASDLSEVGFTPALTGKSAARVILVLSADPALGDQGYRLEVDKDIHVTAATETGLFWGTRTVLQLLAKGPGQPVTHLSIFDKPLLPLRGVMVDVARQFHSIEFHRQFVKRLASYKLNFYHIHFSDDQSYALPSDKYPNLPTPGRHYTKDELRSLVKLAAQYHVTIIPEIDMPGHTSAISKGIPDIVCRGKDPIGPCAGSNRSFNIFKDLISETMSLFPGPYFHIGADEVDFNMWNNCPDCRARKIGEGLKSNEELYNWFINRMNRFVRSKGRRTIVWTGFKPTMQPFIDKNVLVDQWENGYASPLELLRSGYDLLNSTDDPLYWVRTSASEPERIAEWDVWHFGRARAGTPIMAPSKKLLGVGFCSWENTEQSQEAGLFGTGKHVDGYAPAAPRIPIMAERGWTGNSTTAADLLERVGVKAGK